MALRAAVRFDAHCLAAWMALNRQALAPPLRRHF